MAVALVLAVPIAGCAAPRPAQEVTAGAAPDITAMDATVYWTRAYGEARAVDLYLFRDPPDGVHPYVLFGSVTNRGATLRGPRVSITWTGRDGAVVAAREVDVVDPSGAALPELAAGASADFVVVVDDPAVGPALADAEAALRGVSR